MYTTFAPITLFILRTVLTWHKTVTETHTYFPTERPVLYIFVSWTKIFWHVKLNCAVSPFKVELGSKHNAMHITALWLRASWHVLNSDTWTSLPFRCHVAKTVFQNFYLNIYAAFYNQRLSFSCIWLSFPHRTYLAKTMITRFQMRFKVRIS
jgi:hypothetical protein